MMDAVTVLYCQEKRQGAVTSAGALNRSFTVHASSEETLESVSLRDEGEKCALIKSNFIPASKNCKLLA